MSNNDEEIGIDSIFGNNQIENSENQSSSENDDFKKRILERAKNEKIVKNEEIQEQISNTSNTLNTKASDALAGIANSINDSYVNKINTEGTGVNVINPSTVHLYEKENNISSTSETQINLGSDEISTNENISLVSEKKDPEFKNPIQEQIVQEHAKADTSSELQIKEDPNKKIIYKETKESVNQYEQRLQEEELKSFEETTKQQEEEVKEIIENIRNEYSEEKSKEIEQTNLNIIQDPEQIIEQEQQKRIQEKIEKQKEKKNNIEYLGGDADDIASHFFRTKKNAWGKKYASQPEPEKTYSIPFVIDNEEKFKEYLKQKPRFINSILTKIPLPYSGLTLYVRSYSSSTMLNLLNEYSRWRAQQDYAAQQYSTDEVNILKSEAYVKLRELELKSIYNHVEQIYSAKLGKLIEKPDEETFFKMIKYPDLKMFYFAAYHGTNKNKKKRYTITCNHDYINPETNETEPCNNQFFMEYYDEELVFSIPNSNLSKEDFYLLIRDAYPKDRELPLTKDAEIEISRFTETNNNIIQSVPNLYDYIETLHLLLDMITKRTNDNDLSMLDFNYDLSLIDIEIPQDQWSYQRYDKVKYLKSFLYTKKVEVLFLDDDKKGLASYRTINAEDKQRIWIFDILSNLTIDDMYYLTRGEEIKKMMTLKAIDFYVPSCTCPKCKNQIEPIYFDVRSNFFTLLSMSRNAEVR